MFLQVSVILSTGGCAWLGGHAWLPGGCAWLPGGVHGCWGGLCGCQGVHGCRGVRGWGGACVGYDEIRSMSGRYASYWNAFLFFELKSWSAMFKKSVISYNFHVSFKYSSLRYYIVFQYTIIHHKTSTEGRGNSRIVQGTCTHIRKRNARILLFLWRI